MKQHYTYLPVLAGLALASVSRSQDAPPPHDGDIRIEVTGKAASAPAGQGDAKPADAEAAKPYLGVSTSPVPAFLGKHINLKDGEGLLVRLTDPEGPAAKAGIEVDDVITQVKGKPVGASTSMARLLQDHKPGDTIELDTIHLGKPVKVTLALAARPAHLAHGHPDAPGPDADDRGMGIIGGNFLEGLPPELRKQIERQMRDGLQNGGMGLNIVPGAGGLKIVPLDGGNHGGGAFQFNMASDVTVADADGSISLKSGPHGTQARVLDSDGKEVWSGPWETAQDKAAAPPDIRERINRANLNVVPGMKLMPQPQNDEDAEEAEDAQPESAPNDDASE